jgi:hypothetical protein
MLNPLPKAVIRATDSAREPTLNAFSSGQSNYGWEIEGLGLSNVEFISLVINALDIRQGKLLFLNCVVVPALAP